MARPIIAISSCILGQKVRYDAEIKQYPALVSFINQHFELLPICPEVEIGLSVPRPAVQLVADQGQGQPQMVGRDNPDIDVTAQMQQFCEQRPASLHYICGYIFKSRSPSCGISDVPLFNKNNHIIHYGSGLFTQAICRHFPDLPIVNETELDSEQQRQQYLQQVLNYYHDHQQ